MKSLVLCILLTPLFCHGQMKKEQIIFQGITIEKFTPAQIDGCKDAILWLHGLNGTWCSDSWGIGDLVKRGYEFPYVIYCPQNPDQKDWSANELKSLKALIESGHHRYNIVAGHSQGGMGTISAINLFPDFWFAAGISAGKTNLTTYDKFKNIHIRAWHGADDTLMGTSIYRFIDSVYALGGDATYIKYPSPVAHNISGRAFSPSDPNSFWKWLEVRLGPTQAAQPFTEKVISTEVEDGTRLKITTESGKVYYQALSLN